MINKNNKAYDIIYSGDKMRGRNSRPNKNTREDRNKNKREDRNKKTDRNKKEDKGNGYNRNFPKSTKPSSKTIIKANKSKFQQFDPINTGDIRLNKYISDSGFCSRREADTYISMGKVKVDGRIAGIGSKINSRSEVLVNNHLIESVDNTVYIALNKPVGITSTTEHGVADNIVDFVNYPERIFPIGRLDKESEGLILLTNDGDIVNKILRAGNNHEKEYLVRVNKKISEDFIKKMSNGVPILDTVTKKCKVIKIDDHTFKITLVQGLNRQIRRMCEYFGYDVTALKRERIMNINLGKLPIGKWRFLTEKEIEEVKKMISNSHKNI